MTADLADYVIDLIRARWGDVLTDAKLALLAHPETTPSA
jgi:hypothetical protein